IGHRLQHRCREAALALAIAEQTLKTGTVDALGALCRQRFAHDAEGLRLDHGLRSPRQCLVRQNLAADPDARQTVGGHEVLRFRGRSGQRGAKGHGQRGQTSIEADQLPLSRALHTEPRTSASGVYLAEKGRSPNCMCSRRLSIQTGPRSWLNARLLSRSEEHTSEFQSLTNLVCRLLLE